jgi:hypothetical protein
MPARVIIRDPRSALSSIGAFGAMMWLNEW